MSHLIAQGQQADKRLVDTDSFTLYYCLIILVERSSNIASYFRYELTTTLCSLFHGYMLNESGKAALGKILKEDVAVDSRPRASEVVVIDGGASLHHVKWLHNAPLSHILTQYFLLVI